MYPRIKNILLIPFYFLILSWMGPATQSVFGGTQFSPPQVEKLPNGMSIAWFENDKLPIVDISLLVKSGYGCEPRSKVGITELLKTFFVQKMKNVETLGAGHQVISNEDSTVLGIHGLQSDAITFLEELGRTIIHPEFSEQALAQYKRELLDRWGHLKDYPDALLSLAISRGPSLRENEIQNIKIHDLIRYYHQYFEPRNTILVISGQVKKVELRKKIIEVFGSWKNQGIQKEGPRLTKKIVWAFKDKTLIIHRPHSSRALVRFVSPSPPMSDPLHYAIRLANTLLGEGLNSRLNTELRDKLGLVFEIESSLSYSKESGQIVIATSTQDELVGKVIKATFQTLKEFSKKIPTEAELALAKEYMIGRFSLNHATQESLVDRWLTGEVFELNPAYFNEFIPQIQKLKTQEIKAAVERFFDIRQMRVVILGNAPEIQKSMNQMGIKVLSMKNQIPEVFARF